MTDPYVPGRGDDRYRALAYDLDVTYEVASNRLDGRARVDLEALEDLPALDLDLVGLRVSKVSVDGRRARWRHAGEKVRVTPEAPVAAGERVRVEVRYGGNPAPTRSTWGTVGWEELSDGALVAAQPSGACTWFPCNDLARQKATYRIRLTTGAPYLALATGAPVAERRSASTGTWTYELAEPTSPYLVSAHIGRYEAFDLATSPVRLRAVAAPAHHADVRAAFARLPEMVEVFVDRFGPYPFAAGYTVVVCPERLEIPLEAQAQAIFGTNHLVGEDERLIAHELAHQWFGNSLTAASWSDVWLHEGFACYAEWLWSEASGGDPAGAHAARHHERRAGEPQDLLLADPGPDDLFDDRVYKRGALLLHSLRSAMGDGPFFDLLRRWVADHRHGLVTTAEFEAAVGPEHAELLEAWLRRTALPPLGG